jgi:hypothetical protein
MWWGLTGYQWATLVLAPLFIWLWMSDRRHFVVLEPEIAQGGAACSQPGTEGTKRTKRTERTG